MSRYIALLRGINVGGHRKIKMVELKALFERLGFTDVVTYIQSGNVVFTAQDSDNYLLCIVAYIWYEGFFKMKFKNSPHTGNCLSFFEHNHKC